jgi:hypothetical protein
MQQEVDVAGREKSKCMLEADMAPQQVVSEAEYQECSQGVVQVGQMLLTCSHPTSLALRRNEREDQTGSADAAPTVEVFEERLNK